MAKVSVRAVVPGRGRYLSTASPQKPSGNKTSDAKLREEMKAPACIFYRLS